ncbi:GNAT family N-acetyltransferase [Acetobacterium carbinolicum]|jgi:putative acetyltransferase|uniref:GNAT family N-acetyltransferase n=1 Tax=Acetobacterium TaxID=33951 RepID=UPI000DBEB3EB|nr:MULTISPECIES: GNAT family N-acetyltransferase [unclassified Acetobacterium]AWW28087.1 GNAT family N-acetyltransferase [Acetobacterium sp. KB-1]MDZ5726031.1 GNAT family N-acetyltransferase [Acetobacterium sp. K1/6]
MKIINVKDRNAMLIEQLVKVRKASVKETHLFLSDLEIDNIEKYVPQALAGIPNLIVAENQRGVSVAFMGIDEQKLEMLFIHPKERGHGLGRELVEYGIKEYFINELGVNEQNPQAKGFYEHMGFEVYKRTEVDEQGMPYPILYMKLS